MGGLLNRKVVVNLRATDGTRKVRHEVKAGSSFNDIKRAMAVAVYGKRAAALDPSRIDIASLHPTGEYAISSLSGITNNLVITVAIPLGLAGTPGSAAAAAAQGTIATTATAVGAGARSPSGATGGGGAGGGAGAVGTAGAGAGSAAAANGASGGGPGAAAAGGGSPAAARPDFVPHMGYHDPADAAAPKPSSVQRVDDDPSSPVDGFFNFVMAGESGVGKSSLLLNFTKRQFHRSISSTIGIDMRVVTLQMDAVKVKLRLWDSSGQRSFDSITKSYLRSAHGIVVVYDVTSRRSFERAMEWIRFVEDSGSYARANGTLLLVGNKVDCVEGETGRGIPAKQANDAAVAHHIPYFETSAKNGTGIEAPFHFLGMKMLAALPPPLRAAGGDSGGGGSKASPGGARGSGGKKNGGGSGGSHDPPCAIL